MRENKTRGFGPMFQESLLPGCIGIGVFLASAFVYSALCGTVLPPGRGGALPLRVLLLLSGAAAGFLAGRGRPRRKAAYSAIAVGYMFLLLLLCAAALDVSPLLNLSTLCNALILLCGGLAGCCCAARRRKKRGRFTR